MTVYEALINEDKQPSCRPPQSMLWRTMWWALLLGASPTVSFELDCLWTGCLCHRLWSHRLGLHQHWHDHLVANATRYPHQPHFQPHLPHPRFTFDCNLSWLSILECPLGYSSRLALMTGRLSLWDHWLGLVDSLWLPLACCISPWLSFLPFPLLPPSTLPGSISPDLWSSQAS